MQRHTDKGQPVRRRGLRNVRPAIAGVLCVAATIAVAIIAAWGAPASDSAVKKALPTIEAPQVAASLASRSDDVQTGDTAESVDSASWQSAPARTPSGMEIPEELIPEVAATHEERVVLVSLEEGYSAEELTAAINASGCTVPQDITPDDVAAGFAELAVADDYDVEHAMAQLGMLPETAGAQPNYLYSLADDGLGEGAAALRDVLPNMSLTASSAAQSTGINDPYASSQWMLESVKAYDAWDIVKAGNADNRVTVAVIDNGCLVSHVDLAENIVASYNVVSGGQSVPAGAHGTHVCGIIAAQANNGKGIAGVSYNARLMPVQVFDGDSASSSDVAKAYNYIMANAGQFNVRVINMSLGGTVDDASTVADVSLDAADTLLIQKANKAYEAGILTVCSAGNDAKTKGGAYINFPSDFLDNALGVIALSNTSGIARASYSNYNMVGQNTKDISAPGSNILSTYVPNNTSYTRVSGTSMASPCVAGIAALVFSAAPDATAGQVADILCASASKIGNPSAYDGSGFSLQYGYGEVDAHAAVRLATDGLSVTGRSALLVGEEIQLTLVGADAARWSSSNSRVASVSPDGTVTGVGPGTAAITASVGPLTFSKSVTVYKATFDSADTVSVGIATPLTFSCDPVCAAFTFDCADEQIATLTSYDGSTFGVYGVSPGTATITATLASDPDVVVRHTVEVVSASVADASVEAIADQVYSGSAITPDPIVSFQGERLVKNVDYELAYSNNIKQGTATIAITGKGRFAGAKTVTFKIMAASIESASISDVADAVYTGSAIAPAPTVRIGSRALKAGTDYTVSYVDNVNAGTATVTVTGKGNFAGSQSTTFKIARAPISSASVSCASSVTYTGKAAKPAVAVKLGVRALKAGTDFAVSYADNVNAGTAAITVTGKGNYEGVKSATFEIARAPISSASISCVSSVAYTGKAAKPAVAVKLGVRALKAGTDFAVSYTNNVNAGTATITVTGKGNYTGSKSVKFTISGWINKGGKRYYCLPNGKMATGWQKIGGKRYLFGSTGAMLTGWRKVSGAWYWLGTDGAMRTGWQKIGGKWYYLKSSGKMATGWCKVSGSWYYLKSSGKMATGWQKVGGKWYYLKSSGAMVTGRYKIAGTWYRFNASGVWVS